MTNFQLEFDYSDAVLYWKEAFQDAVLSAQLKACGIAETVSTSPRRGLIYNGQQDTQSTFLYCCASLLQLAATAADVVAYVAIALHKQQSTVITCNASKSSCM